MLIEIQMVKSKEHILKDLWSNPYIYIYMDQPLGYIKYKNKHKLYKLKNVLYILKLRL